MIEHKYTESTQTNFSKLEERIMNINDPNLGKFNQIREMLYELTIKNEPTLLMATGGSKGIAYYLQSILERIGLAGMLCEVIEPRDYSYKANTEMYSNLIVISASGKTNGIITALNDFKGQKYLICEHEQEGQFQVIPWQNELYEPEKSFVSLAATLGPITLLLDATTSLNLEIGPQEIRKINSKIQDLFIKSKQKIDNLQADFEDATLIQIMSGYETKTSASVLESNLIETGLSVPVIHDKGSFCHGRSNLLFQNPNSHIIYLTHHLKEFDTTLLNSISNEYTNLSVLDTFDLDESIFWKEYYLLLQMYFLSKKIAEDKHQELTQPEYNPRLIKKLYNFKGEM